MTVRSLTVATHHLSCLPQQGIAHPLHQHHVHKLRDRRCQFLSNQHFCGQAIAHSLVKDVLIRSFPKCFYYAYQRDIEYSTKSLVICLNEDKSIENKIDILYAYIKAFSESEHKEYCLPYEIVANNYNNEDDLIQLWKKLVANKIVNKQFGELLCDRLSSNESIVSDIKKDIEEVENNDKDEPDSK